MDRTPEGTAASQRDRRRLGRPHGLRELLGGPKLLWSLLAVVVLVASLARIVGYSSFVEPPRLTENDFSPDYVSAREWRSGGDPYSPLSGLNEKYFGADDPSVRQYEPRQRNPHPPSLILLYAPLSALGIEAARAIILVVMLVSTLLAMYLFLREIGLRTQTSVFLAVGAVALPVVAFDLRWAQSNGLLLLGLVLAWKDLRRGKELRAGVLLGAVTALKVFPWMLIIPLLRTKRMKAAGWMVASAIAFSLVSVAALGVDAARTFLTVATPGNVEIWGAAPHSISLVTLPFRLFAADRWLDPSVSVPAWIGWLSVAAVAACAVAAWHSSAAISRDPYWAVVPWMILGTPIAWAHYLVLALPLGIFILLRWRRTDPLLRAFLGLACLLILIGSSYLDWLSRVAGFSLQRYGNVVAGTTILVAGLAVIGIADLRANRGRSSGLRGRDPDDRVPVRVGDA